MKLNIHRTVCCVESEGPGRRYAIWVQGCPRRCKGCGNPHLQDISPKHIVDCDEVFGRILKAKELGGVEGITVGGGEPMLQAESLSHLAFMCQEEQLSVMVFTGYRMEELLADEIPGVQAFLQHTDILVDGPFDQKRLETARHWVGSTNQKFYYLSDRYESGLEYEGIEQGRRITPYDFRSIDTLPILDYGDVFQVIRLPDCQGEWYGC